MAAPAAVDAVLDQAAVACLRRGAQLTALRRQVLRLVLEAGQPVGAYTLLDRLKASRAGAAPPTVYRALDFLREHGLIHRVERLNAYVGCIEAPSHPSDCDCTEGHDHPHQFLICRHCGATAEISDQGVAAALAAAALRHGFTLHRATMEAEGLCRACAASIPPVAALPAAAPGS